MRTYTPKSFEQIVQSMISWVSGVSSQLTDFNVGSRIRTILEAVAQEIDELYFQARVGLETGMRQGIFDAFQFAAKPATKSTGTVTFSRSTAAGQDYNIPAGTIVSTVPTALESAKSFEVLESVTLQTGDSSVDAKVRAVEAGADSNIAAGAISVVSVAGIDAVTNSLAFTTGADAETSIQRADRFSRYIQTLQRGTKESIEYAASQVDNIAGAVAVDSPWLDGITLAGGNSTDVSDELNMPGGTAVDVFAAVPANNDAFYVGASRRFDGLYFALRTAAKYAGNACTWQYYNGAWVSIPHIVDLSQKLTASDRVQWNFSDVADWKQTTVAGKKDYWVRLMVSTAANITTNPQISHAYAMPGPGTVRLYAHDSFGELPNTTANPLADTVATAVEEYRPAGVKLTVLAPVKKQLSVTASIEIARGYSAADVLAEVEAAIRIYCGNFQVGQRLVFDELVQIVMNCNDAAVANVAWTTPTADVEVSPEQLIMLDNLTISEG